MSSNFRPEKKEDIKFTRSELNKIEKAMRNPEFKSLLNEYVNEISDPKNKDEYEQYLKQMEEQKDLPPNTLLMRPRPLFCIKTNSRRLITGKEVTHVENKIFANICVLGSVKEPIETIQNSKEAKGSSWSLPYSLSKGRPERDSKDKVCMVYDVIFNPKCEKLCETANFKKMICETAIDAVTSFLKEYKEEVSKDYKVIQISKRKCQGKEPSLILVKKEDENRSNLATNPDSYETELQKEINKSKNENKENKKELDDVEEVDESEAPDIIAKSTPSKPFDIVEQYDVDLADNFDGPRVSKFPRKIPKVIEIRIYGQVDISLGSANLEIKEKDLIYEYPGKDSLKIKLPYSIRPLTAKAKYKRDFSTLSISVQVDLKKYEETPTKKDTEENSSNENLVLKENSQEAIQKEEVQKLNENQKESEIEIVKIESNSSKESKNFTQDLAKAFERSKPAEINPPEGKMEIKYKIDTEINNQKDSSELLNQDPQKPKDLIKEIADKHIEEVNIEEKKNESNMININLEKTNSKNVNENENQNQKKIQYEIAKAEYTFTDTKNFVFVIFKTKNYSKNSVRFECNDNEFLLEFDDHDKKKRMRICLTTFDEYDSVDSTVEKMKSDIYVKLKKKADRALNKWTSAGYEIEKLKVKENKENSKENENGNGKNEGKEMEENKIKNELEQKEQKEDEEDEEKESKRSYIMHKNLECKIIYEIY